MSREQNMIQRLILTLVAVCFSFSVFAQDPIRVVGSSTVYPFTTNVAEKFGKLYGSTPIVESTGTGGGMKLFCAGATIETPSVTGASRAIKSKEAKMCADNGVSYIEVMIGNDGIAFANSLSGPQLNLTKKQLWLAMAELGPKPSKWSEIDPSLPDMEISILSPPPTSGTRDAWNSLVMKKGCPKDILESQGKKKCYQLREDGAVTEVGENDALIIQKLQDNEVRFGIFGFSYLDNAGDKIKPMTIESVEITLDTIQSYEYPIARPLFVYFKKEHFEYVPGLKDFIKFYVSDSIMGPEGALMDIGLVPLDPATFEEMVASIQ